MIPLKLYIGNKNYSSWSFRPWIGLKFLDLPFEEEVIPLFQEGSKQKILSISPSGKVPCLQHGDRVIWDSLAILEYAHELAPEKNLLPSDPALRALVRSMACEMHAGFLNLRKEFSMNMKKRETKDISVETQHDLERIYQMWDQCKKFHRSGPFLLGDFTLIDAFFAPVVSRIISYGLPQNHHEQYIHSISNLDIYKEWEQAALKEPWVINH